MSRNSLTVCQKEYLSWVCGVDRKLYHSRVRFSIHTIHSGKIFIIPRFFRMREEIIHDLQRWFCPPVRGDNSRFFVRLYERSSWIISSSSRTNCGITFSKFLSYFVCLYIYLITLYSPSSSNMTLQLSL